MGIFFHSLGNYYLEAQDAVLVSRFLEKFKPFDLPAGNFKQVWLTLHVQDGAALGQYRGRVEVNPANAPPTTLPIELEVLPFTLKTPTEKRYGLYYVGQRKAFVPAELRDIREHGADLLIWDARIEFTKENDDVRIGYGKVIERLNTLKQFGFQPPYIVWTGFDWLARLLGLTEEVKVGRRGIEVVASAAAETDERFLQLTKQALKGLDKVRQEHGYGEIVLSHLDEVVGHRYRFQSYLRLSKAARQVLGFRLYQTVHTEPASGFEPLMKQIEPFVDIRCQHGHSLDEWIASGHSFEELAQEFKVSGDEGWCYYNPRSVDVTPEWMRIINGLWLWCSPLKAHVPWAYNSYNGDPFDDSDGHDYGFAFPDDDGNIVPTRLWEAYREGVDDMRYLFTLEEAIRKARQSGRKAKEREEAERFLSELRALMPKQFAKTEPSAVVKRLAEEMSGDDWQQLRYRMARHISALLR